VNAIHGVESIVDCVPGFRYFSLPPLKDVGIDVGSVAINGDHHPFMVNEPIGYSEDTIVNNAVPVFGPRNVIESEFEAFKGEFIDHSDVFFYSHNPGQNDKVLCNHLQGFGLHVFHGFTDFAMVFVFAGDITEAFVGSSVELSVADDALSVVADRFLTHKKSVSYLS
jgi:hypothetical protein